MESKCGATQSQMGIYAPLSIPLFVLKEVPCIASARDFFNRSSAIPVGVEDLLSHPLLWRGQGTSFAHTPAIATGFDALDRYLPGGGWPLTGISEIFIEHYGLGELRVLMPALASLSRRAVEVKKWIVWVAPPFVPYAPALAHHGVDLSRILLVHPPSSKKEAKKKVAEPAGSDPKDTLWAVEQAIRSQSSVATLAWVKEADQTALRRLQLGAETHRCWTVLFRPVETIKQNSPAALRFRLLSGSELPSWDQASIRVEIDKCRGRKPKSFLLSEPGLDRC
jgi:cell division inhibitor SulA/protein ImuA